MSELDEREARLAKLEEALGHRFSDREKLEQALRHASYAHEQISGSSRGGEALATRESNERLEFLGDAVLALVVAEALYAAKPDWQEGDLSRALHSIVEGRSLAALARSLEVGAVLRLGRTEISSGGQEKASILENALEALVGALYLDGGLDAARRFVTGHFGNALAADAVRVERDPKTELQETLMAESGEFPSYRIVGDNEIEGDDDRFIAEAFFQGEVLGRGVGRTKRAAERSAARRALDKRDSMAGEADRV
jgi:ribonuclease III